MKEKKRRVKNLIVEQEFMDVLEQELVNAPSSWLLIKYGTYKELHYEDGIYRFFDAKKLNELRKFVFEEKKENPFYFGGKPEQAETVLYSLNHNKESKEAKERRPGYKRLNKQMIKNLAKRDNTRGY